MKGGTDCNCNSNSGTSYNGLIGFEGNSSNNININIPSNYNQLEDENRVSAHAMNMINVMPQEQDYGSSSTNQTHHHHDQHQQMIKAKILAHPLFPRLLAAYVNCQKVGAPPEVVGRLEQASSSLYAMRMMRVNVAGSIEGAAGGGDDDGDPALDQFMEAYCEMLIKYHQELTKPIKEAMLFLSTIHSQLHALTTLNNSSSHQSASKGDCVGGSECSESEDVDVNASYIDPEAEDGELKVELLRKYSGYLGSLKQKFLKTKKNGKLPEEARHQLLQWWTAHYKWPYPSEAEKVVLAESTGLDLKQINNWFINQRKRHWKPSEDHMQFDFMDAATTHHPRTHHYTDNNVMICNPFPMD